MRYPPYVLLSGDVESTIDNASKLAKFVNDYGFMIVFSVIALIVAVMFFLHYEKQASKKNNNDTEILYKERQASIEQNKQMFDLVTTVQTEQVSQLQHMTTVLQDISSCVRSTSECTKTQNEYIDKIEKDMVALSIRNDSIADVVDEILDYAKETTKCDMEILEKINKIDQMINDSTKKS